MKQEILLRLREQVVVAVIRTDTADVVPELLRCLVRGGLRTMEITLTIPSAIPMINRLSEEYAGDREVLVGAGTVLDVGQAREAIDAGAKFIVSPTVEPNVIRYCRDQDVPIIPGAMTPTEILSAWRLGADIVKVFPAGSLGASYFSDVAGPLPHIPLLATGGIRSDNIVSFLKAGAVAVGVGSAVLDKKWIAGARYEDLQVRVQELMSLVKAHRSSQL